MPSRPDRVRVWNGEIKRTRGGLMRVDLVKNKSGKIVSRRRSAAAKAGSNLGKWLRVKGHKFRDVPEGAVKGAAKATKPKPKPPKKPPPKPKKTEPKPKPKPSPALPKPKKTEPKKQARPKPVAAPPKRPAPKASSSLGKSKYGISGSVAQPRMSRKEREAKKYKISVANVIGGVPSKKKKVELTDHELLMIKLGIA